jgi:uncharacterized integral membrane protein
MLETDNNRMKTTSFSINGKGDQIKDGLEENKKNTTGRRERGMYVKTLMLGAVSLILYAILFTHQEAVTAVCARGHWCAAFPIIIVLVFSLIHGSFANYSLDLLGVKAKQRK